VLVALATRSGGCKAASASLSHELFNRLTRALDKTLDWVTREGLAQATSL
jgi:hypothetical protein